MAQLSLPAHLLVKGNEVPRQCHSSTGALDLEKGRPPRFFGGFKPHKGGLYSAPLLTCGLSAWEKFCFEENFHSDRLTVRTLFFVREEATLVKIDGLDDVHAFDEDWWGRPFLNTGINGRHLYWQRILNHIDGVWFTQAGAEAAAELLMSRHYVGVWDVETVFLKSPAHNVTDPVISTGPAASSSVFRSCWDGYSGE